MTRGRKADPSRTRRQTGHRPMPGQAKPLKEDVGIIVAEIVRANRKRAAGSTEAPPAVKKAAPKKRPPKKKPGTEIEPVIVYPVHLPTPPDHLTEGAKAVFRRVAEELDVRGLRDNDIAALAMLAHHAWMHEEAVRNIQSHGLYIVTEKGMAMNPFIKVARDETKAYMALAAEFGLTPAARMRLGLMNLAGQSLAQTLSSELDRL